MNHLGNLKALCVFLLLLFSSCKVHAEVVFIDDYTSLNHIYPYSGGLIFYVDYSDLTLSTCSSGKGFSIPIDHANYEVMSSIMISAFHAEQRIKFAYDRDQTPTCTPRIDRFIVKK